MVRSPLTQSDRVTENAAVLSNIAQTPIWEVVVEIGKQIPDEEWAKVPADAAMNYKHYLYGIVTADT